MPRFRGTRYPLLCRSSAFSPLSIPNLALWLTPEYGLYQERTGASATTPAVADGDPVGTWAGRRNTASGDVYVTARLNDACRPALKLALSNGHPGIQSDTTDDGLVVPTGAQYTGIDRTVFAVLKSLSGAGGFPLAQSNSYGLVSHNVAGGRTRHWGGNGVIVGTTSLASTFHVLEARWTQSINLNEIWTDGADYQSATSSVTESEEQLAYVLGGDYWGQSVQCLAIVWYTRALSDSERNTVRGWLQTRYGL